MVAGDGSQTWDAGPAGGDVKGDGGRLFIVRGQLCIWTGGTRKRLLVWAWIAICELRVSNSFFMCVDGEINCVCVCV